MTICPKFERIRVLMDGAKATAAASNVTDLKHPRGCTCSPCETKIGEMASMQERYLQETVSSQIPRRRTNKCSKSCEDSLEPFVKITDGSSISKRGFLDNLNISNIRRAELVW